MARMQLTYPQPAYTEPEPLPAPTPTYADPPTKTYRNHLKLLPLFGFPSIPIGPAKTQSVYDQTDPAVRALYGLDDPNRNATPTATAAAGDPATAPAKVYTPYTNYGVNDTGRTLSPNPNPTYANTTTLPMDAPKYPAGSGSPSMQGGTANPDPTNPLAKLGGGDFGGFLGGLLSLFGVKTGSQEAPYEAALRERPEDIQRLVSMTKRPPEERSANYGGFLGGMFDEPKG